jgi:hypothetical protein
MGAWFGSVQAFGSALTEGMGGCADARDAASTREEEFIRFDGFGLPMKTGAEARQHLAFSAAGNCSLHELPLLLIAYDKHSPYPMSLRQPCE